MLSNENPIYGRKIFFLNPPYAIKTNIVERLRTLEYETYIIENYKIAKETLRMYKDSICFIDIDTELSVQEWFNFVKSFEDDTELSTIYVGILSQRIKTSDKNQFLLKASIPGGFIMLSEGLEKITEKIIAICEINGAKGRRQYVRLDCKNENNATVHITKNNRLVSMKLIDISSVGFACALQLKDKSFFQNKELLKNVIISLDTKTIHCEAAIFAIKDGELYSTLVVLLLPSTPVSTRQLIRNYVFSTLQRNLDIKTSFMKDDLTDYSVEPKIIKKDISSKFINDEDVIDLLDDDITDLEDISNTNEIFI